MPTIKSTVKWDGEQQFKQSTKELNNELSTLRSEMSKVTAQFSDNTGSVESLTAKNEVLSKQLDTQQKKVDALKQAHAQAAEAYGESDARTQKWAQQLNYAEAAVYKTQHAIDENNESLKEANDQYSTMGDEVETASGETVSFGSVVDQIANKLGISLPEGMTKSIDGLGSIDAGLAASVAGALALVAAVVKLEDTLADMTKRQAEAADEINTAAKIASLSTETIQELNYAQDYFDVSTSTVTGSMAKLTKTMADARDGNEDLMDTYDKLGVSITDSDGNLRSSEEVFWDVIDALGKMDNQAERDSASMKLMGESANTLNPLILATSAGFEALTQKAHDLGIIMEDEGVNVLQDYQDALDDAENQSNAMEQQIAMRFAPTLTEFTNEWTDLKGIFADMAVDSGLVDMLAMLLDIVNSLFQLLKPIIQLTAPLANGLIKPIAWALGFVADTIAVICNGLAALIELISAIIRKISTGSWKYNMEYLQNIASVGTSGFTSNYINGNASGTDNFTGGLTWVNEDGPERAILPSGTQILPSREASGGYGPIYVTIDAKNIREFNDVVQIFEDARMSQRQGFSGG